MIDLALNFLNTQLDNYLRDKLDPTNHSPFIQLANIAWNDADNSVSPKDPSSSAFITLVNIEEDRISKSPEGFTRNNNNSIVYKNPQIYLNLYVLFSVNLSSYSESLKRLSLIIQYFQYKNVFTTLNSSGLPAGVDKLILDLSTLSFQDMNNLWGILGSKYLPSVMYKLRLIKISEEFAQGDAALIHEIMVNDKPLQTL
jgi:hypothetical protein